MTLTLTRSEKIFGGVYLLLQTLLVPFAVTALCMALGNPSDALINLICFFSNALLALVFFRRLLVRSWRNAARDWKRTLAVTVKGFGLYWAINLLITAAILALRPDFANANDAGVNAMIDEYPVLMTVAVIFAAPLAEECLFRGWIFTGLAQKSVPLAYAVSCGLFAAAHLVGRLDFQSFCDTKPGKKSTVRRVDSITFSREGTDLVIDFRGEGFLYHMVRIMTGTLAEVGARRLLPGQIPGILEAKNRKQAGPLAPACGLMLMEVTY